MTRLRKALTLSLAMFLLLWIFIGGQGSALNPWTYTKARFSSDFIEYWTAARLHLSGGNPYSREELLTLQKEVGWTNDKPLIMWNPPWTLFFIIPFGLMSFSTGQFFWLLFHSIILVFCIQYLWRFYGGSTRYFGLAWVVGFTFAPTIFVLILGQVTSLVLVGLVGFLHFQKSNQWLGTGAALVTIAIKPQLAYLFWIVLVLWVINKRHWQIFSACMFALLVSLLTLFSLNASVVRQYIVLYLTSEPPTPFHWATPTLGSFLQDYLAVESLSVQFLPSLFGVSWVIIYWFKKRPQWNWAAEMPLLLLASVATSPFAWTFDQVILLPFIMQVGVWLVQSRNVLIVGLAAFWFLAINSVVLAMKLFSPTYDDSWYVWLAPVWLITYLALRKVVSKK